MCFYEFHPHVTIVMQVLSSLNVMLHLYANLVLLKFLIQIVGILKAAHSKKFPMLASFSVCVHCSSYFCEHVLLVHVLLYMSADIQCGFKLRIELLLSMVTVVYQLIKVMSMFLIVP